MARARELLAAAVLLGVLGTAGAAEPPASDAAPLAVPGLRRDQPITVTSRTLEYDYKTNVVVYRGDVEAVQGDVHLRSDELIIRLLSKNAKKDGTAETKSAGDGA